MKREVKNEEYFLAQIKNAVKSNLRDRQFNVKNLINRKVAFKNIEFQFTKSVSIVEDGIELSFNNCSFSGGRIDITLNKFQDNYSNFEFENCEVFDDFFIKDSKINNLAITNTDFESSKFQISSNSIYFLSIVGNPEKNNKIKSLILNENKIIDSLDVRLNSFSQILLLSDNEISDLQINANDIEKIDITSNINDKRFLFWKNTLKNFSIIRDSSFGVIEAKENNFGIETLFSDNEFLEKSYFTGLKSPKSTLKFENCNFYKNTYYDNSTVLSLEFKSVLFHGITSFQNLTCNHLLKFDTSHFEKVAFFEKSKIGSINSIDINTIRTIKSQLLRTENKYEYLKFNSLEQRKHLQILGWSDSDLYILLFNKWSNDFGRNWFKGVKFTLKISIFFFIVLIIVNSFITSNYPLNFNINNSFADISTVLSEYLSFTFSFGFGNNELQGNGYLYLIFIIGKIFIGYGIYQTISAFRKYGRM